MKGKGIIYVGNGRLTVYFYSFLRNYCNLKLIYLPTENICQRECCYEGMCVRGNVVMRECLSERMLL